jgi:hypothetical protein
MPVLYLKDVKCMLLSDSMTNNVVPIEGLEIWTYPGQTPNGLAQVLEERQLPFEDCMVVGFNVGTNRLDYARQRWKCSPKSQAEQVIAEIRGMLQKMRKVNPRAFVILFTVIPRPIDHAKTHKACQLFNQMLYHECKRARYGYAPTWRTFAEKMPKGPSQPTSRQHQQMPPLVPKRELFTSKGLHLTNAGADLLRQRIAFYFHPTNVAQMMARARWRLEDKKRWDANNPRN